MKEFFKTNFLVILLVAAVAFGMWQWHRAEVTGAINEEMWRENRINTKLEQTQNILYQLEFRDDGVATAFRQVGYQIRQPKPTKQDTAIVSKRHGN